MSVPIDVIVGFLESGKTTLIEKLLRRNILGKNERVVVLLCEEGIEELKIDKYDENVIVKTIENKNQLSYELFKNIRKEYNPNRIIIEYNGTWEVSDLLKVRVPSNYNIEKIFCTINAETFISYMSNMRNIILDHLMNSDCIILNRHKTLSKKELKNMKKIISGINKKSVIINENINEEISKFICNEELKSKENFIILMIWIVIFYMILSILKYKNMIPSIEKIRDVNILFLSILIEAIPFVLIGVFVSSILQIVVPDYKIINLFGKNRWFSFPLAAFMGIFFPVCDCAMAPITARMVKKGIPLSKAVTFMLAAPVVNPVVIISTFYAFPSNHKIVFYRIILGIIVSIITGIIVEMFYNKENNIEINNTSSYLSCSSGDIGKIYNHGILGTVEAIFKHAGLEFLNVSKYVIVGALISATVQKLIPREFFSYIATNNVKSILVMILAAFILSVCANSNAFIARSFQGTFPITSLLAFMIMGPMLDIKNLFMLIGNFNKKFVVTLICIVLTVGVSIFSLVSIIL